MQKNTGNGMELEILRRHIHAVVFRRQLQDPWRLSFISSNIVTLTGYSQQDFLQSKLSWKDIIFSSDLDRFESLVNDIADGLEDEYELNYRILNSGDDVVSVQEKGKVVFCGSDCYIEGIILPDIQDKAVNTHSFDFNESGDMHYSSLLLKLPGMAYMCLNDDNRTMRFVSDGCFELTGYRPEELIENQNLFFDHIIHPDYRKILMDEWQKRISEQSVFHFEYPIITVDGNEKWVWEQGRTVFSSDGEVIGIEGFISDITDYRMKRERLSKSEELFRGLFDTIPSGCAIYRVINDGSRGSDYIITDFNQTALRLEGKGKEEVVGRSLYDLRPNIDQYGLIDVFQRVWITGESAYYPARVYSDERFENWYENYIFKVPTGEIVAIYNDVTDKMKSQQVLRESQQRLSALFENAMDSIFLVNDSMKYVDANPAACELTGYSKEELLKMFISDISHPKKHDVAKRMWKMFIEDGKMSGEYTIERKDRQLIEVEFFAAANIVPGLHLSILRDITERKTTEKKLREKEEYNRSVVGAIPGMIIRSNSEGEYLDILKSSELKLPFKVEEILGKKVTDVFPQDEGQRILVHIKMALATMSLQVIEYPLQLPDGKFWFEARIAPLNETEVIALVLDITERKHLDEMKNKEILLKEVHHRVKNNLQIISSLLNLQSRNFDSHAVKNAFIDSQNRVRSMSLAHEKLYQSPDMSTIEMSDYIKSIAGYLYQIYNMDEHTEMIIETDTAYFSVDTAVPLGLMLNELVTNSLKHAFPEEKEGSVTIRFTCEDGYTLEVADDGIGIADISEYESSPSLGLKIVYMLADQLNATVEVDTSNGTSFTVSF